MRLIISICIFTTVICFHGPLNRCSQTKSYSAFDKNIKNHKTPKSRISKLSMGVEHLVNCAANGISNGFLNSDMCLDHDMNHVFQMFATDVFERIVTIGMLVAFYFYFKRLAVTQPVTTNNGSGGGGRSRRSNRSAMNSNYNDSKDFDFTNNKCNDNYDGDGDEDDSFDNYQECPKCNGTGRNLFNKSMLCDLCSGTGEIDLPSVPKRYNLPTSRPPPSSPYDNE